MVFYLVLCFNVAFYSLFVIFSFMLHCSQYILSFFHFLEIIVLFFFILYLIISFGPLQFLQQHFFLSLKNAKPLYFISHQVFGTLHLDIIRYYFIYYFLFSLLNIINAKISHYVTVFIFYSGHIAVH